MLLRGDFPLSLDFLEAGGGICNKKHPELCPCLFALKNKAKLDLLLTGLTRAPPLPRLVTSRDQGLTTATC